MLLLDVHQYVLQRGEVEAAQAAVMFRAFFTFKVNLTRTGSIFQT